MPWSQQVQEREVFRRALHGTQGDGQLPLRGPLYRFWLQQHPRIRQPDRHIRPLGVHGQHGDGRSGHAIFWGRSPVHLDRMGSGQDHRPREAHDLHHRHGRVVERIVQEEACDLEPGGEGRRLPGRGRGERGARRLGLR